ncbi:MAG: hypothetical protein EXR63_04100 [Dehalococcoidia bacterium]|nr:hypothetical protein [Dehalococcoidia bacterium]
MSWLFGRPGLGWNGTWYFFVGWPRVGVRIRTRPDMRCWIAPKSPTEFIEALTRLTGRSA